MANEFLRRDVLTHMKLQKLVYLAHGWYLANSDQEPLIVESIEAWDYGPVIRDLYAAFAKYGGDEIDTPHWTFGVKDGKIQHVTPAIDEDDQLAQKVIDRVWDVYGKFTPFQLSAMTHREGTPWFVSRKEGRSIIPKRIIFEHFRELSRQRVA